MTESDLSISGEQNIAGLDVSMDDKVLMKEVETLTHLVANTTYLRLGQRLLQLLHDTVHRTAAAELYVHLSQRQHRHRTLCTSVTSTTPPQNSMYICHNDNTATELYVHLSHRQHRHRTLCTSVTSTTPPQNSMYVFCTEPYVCLPQ